MPLVSIRLHAHNPGPLTGDGTFTYLLVGGDGNATLIDAGQARDPHLRDVAQALATNGVRLERVLVTHAHGDHIAGAPALASAYPGAAFLKMPWPDADARYPAPWQPLGDLACVAVGGDVLTAIHTPGHAPDHLCFWHEATRTLYAGDLVWPGATVMIPTRGGDLAAYLASIERVRDLGPARLIPAHGDPIDNPDRFLRRTLEQRRVREQQVLDALAEGHATVQAVTEYIYDGLAPALMPAACETVLAHLEKLRREGRAVETDGRWTA